MADTPPALLIGLGENDKARVYGVSVQGPVGVVTFMASVFRDQWAS